MGKKFSLRGKIARKALNHGVPGPGTYNANHHDKPTNPKYSLGPRTPQVKMGDDTPGPGTYVTRKEAGSGKKAFSLKSRIYEGDHSVKVPGPGAYEEHGRIGTQALSAHFTSRPRGVDFSSTPGPGYYESPTAFSKSNGKGFTLKAKSNLRENDAGIPGPATYYPEDTLGKAAPAPSFGVVLKDPTNPAHFERSPGPAAYAADCRIGMGKKFSLRGKIARKALNHGVPGPGTYNANHHDKPTNPKYSLGPRTPQVKMGDDTPGPGTYITRKEAGSGKKAFSLSSRYKSGSQTERTPGAIYHPRDPNHSSKSFSLGGRVYSVNYENANTPGPGSYNLSRSFVKGGFSLKGSPILSSTFFFF